MSSHNDTDRRAVLAAVIGVEQPGGTRKTRWTLAEVAERAGLSARRTEQLLRALADEEPPLAYSDVDAKTGQRLWWMLPLGPDELDRLEAEQR